MRHARTRSEKCASQPDAGRAQCSVGSIDHIRSTSSDRFDYAEGTIYPALHRLEDEGLLRSTWVDVEGRRRRAYRLTARGRTALDGRRKDWERFASSVQAVLNQ